MSTNYLDLDIEVVKLTFNHRDDGTTDTVYIGDDYYQANEIYSGSPTVYPLLASRPIAQRGIGLNMGIKFDISLSIYSETTFKVEGQNFLDYLSEYDTHGAAVELLYYSKSFYGTTTHSDSVNIRQTLETTRATNQDGIITFECTDKWFDDQLIGRRLLAEDFSNLEDGFSGSYGAIAFGSSVIIDAPIIVVGSNSIDLFCGWATSTNNVGDVQNMYVRNPSPSLSSDTWLPFSFSTSDFLSGGEGRIYGEASTSISGWSVSYSLSHVHRGLPIDRSDSIILAGTRIDCWRNGTINAGEGKLSCRVYQIEQTADWDEVGASIAEVPIDATALGTSSGVANSEAITFNPPVVLPGGKKYMIQWVFENESLTNYPLIRTKASSGDVFYERDVQTMGRGASWVGIADEALHAAMYALVANSDVDDSSGAKYFKSKELYEVPGLGAEAWAGLQFKVAVNGLEDDGSGTITGSANGSLERASWIIEFLLRNSDLGIGHPSSKIDTTAFDSAAVEQGVFGLGVSFAIYEPRLLSELIGDLCFQSRSVFYKNRDGSLALKTPTWSGSLDYTIRESVLENDFALISSEDREHESIINEVVVAYNEDLLQNKDDALVALKTGSTQFEGVYYLESNDSSDGDTFREGQALLSQNKYGVRRFSANLTHHDSAASAKRLASYYFDRYHELQKRVKFRVLRKDYESIDLFDKIKVKAHGLATHEGSSRRALISDDGSPVSVYDDGVLVPVVRLGGVEGEVVEIAEYGPYMEITIETVSLF